MNKIDSDVAWFVGATLGDGSLSGRMVRVWNNEEYVTNKWIEILKKEFAISEDKIKRRGLKKDRNGFSRNEETVEVTVNSTQFNREIKNLSQEVFHSNDLEAVRSSLQGIFDAEGSICGRCEIVLWQRKNKQGDLIANFVRCNLQKLNIKFVEDPNDEFHIIRTLGGLRNKENFVRFSELIGFSHPKKKTWLNLDLEILSLNKKIEEYEIIQFLQERGSATIKEMVLQFKVIETRIRRCLRKLQAKNLIVKSNTWPRRFSTSISRIA